MSARAILLRRLSVSGSRNPVDVMRSTGCWLGLTWSVDSIMSMRVPRAALCGIPLDRPVPGHRSIWRFRQHLTRKDEAGVSLGERLLAAINRQLGEKGLVLKRGTLIDASIVTSAARPPKGDVGEVSPVDPDAGFTRKNRKTFFGRTFPRNLSPIRV